MGTYYAHTIEGEPESSWQTLADHLSGTAIRSRDFAELFDAGEWAYLLGQLHDLGKATPAFQARLHGSAIQVDHASAGAQWLKENYKTLGFALAYLVAGHHGGLMNCANGERRSSLESRLAEDHLEGIAVEEYINKTDAQLFKNDMPRWLRELVKRNAEQQDGSLAFSFFFLLEMLYSCLVDADYLDTESFVAPHISEKRQAAGPSLSEMTELYDTFLAALEESSPDTPVNRARRHIRNLVLEKAPLPSGIFALTSLTGAGKTFTSLGFALHHGLAHDKRRVIYAIPFTSIVEQTAASFKKVFGPDAVLEHHFNYVYDSNDWESAEAERLSTENWDAPLIVTTNVQLFESIFAGKPSKSRKLHNLAGSVIILDEVQSLPDGLLQCCLASLEELCRHYKVTVVLCSATQPAFAWNWPFSSHVTTLLDEADLHRELFDGRATITYDGECTVQSLVDECTSREQVLCIVSSRRAAKILYEQLIGVCPEEEVWHLSALMTPVHRSEVIARIKEDLRLGRPCRVVSTQLVEAGVDLDFPIVLREIAGIDSILQAAGRCNREGRRPTGRVHVFDCPELRGKKRSGWLQAMRDLGQETIACCQSSGVNPFSKDGVDYFFQSRYQVVETDAKHIFKSICDIHRMAEARYDFEEYGSDFRFIEDGGYTIFVPHDDTSRKLLAQLENEECDFTLSRHLQRYCISVPTNMAMQLLADSVIAQLKESGPFILEPEIGVAYHYDNKIGLVVDAKADVLIL